MSDIMDIQRTFRKTAWQCYYNGRDEQIARAVLSATPKRGAGRFNIRDIGLRRIAPWLTV